MNLNRLTLFLKVAEAGSLSKASSTVFLSQPAISLQIQALENETKMKLFERNNRGLVLTDEGKILYERAKLLLEWQEETLNILEEQKTPKGAIRIGTYTTISSYLLPSKLKNFFDEYPEIQILYDYSSFENCLAKLRNRELDLIVMSEVPDVAGVIKIPLTKDSLVLTASVKNKEIGHSITPAELCKHRYLHYPHKFDHCYREIERKLGKYLAQGKSVIVSESFDTLKQSVLNDLGITFMPRYLIENEIREKKLKIIDLKSIHLPIQFFLVLRTDYARSIKLKAFKDSIVATFKSDA